MLSQCLATLFGCFVSRDYDIPDVLYIRPISITVRERCLSVIYKKDNGYNTEMGPTKPTESLSDKLETLYLLCTNVDSYARAAQSLQDFLRSGRSLHVQYVTSSDGADRVVTDVEEYIEDWTPSTTSVGSEPVKTQQQDGRSDIDNAIRRYRCHFGNHFNPTLMLRDDKYAHFTFSIDHGPIYWIAALRTGERGNRFPKDERFANVVRHKTLSFLLKNQAV